MTLSREWLLSDRPASRRQARLGQAYRTWLGFRGNWLAMVGLGVVVLLIGLAILADVIAPFDPVIPGDLRTERFLPPGTGRIFWEPTIRRATSSAESSTDRG